MTEGQKRADGFLRLIRDEDKDIREMRLKVEFLKYKAAGGGAIRYDKDRVQTTPEDILSQAMAEAVDLEQKIRDRECEITDRRIRTNMIIHSWDEYDLALVIMIYYLSNGSMTDVARKIKRSTRHAYRLKLEALEKFSENL